MRVISVFLFWCILSLTCNYKLFAQQVGWKNNYQAVSGSSYTLAFGIAATDNNSVFVVGQFSNIVDFGGDTLSESLSDQDGFLLKLDSAGNTIWAQKIATGDRGSSGFRIEARNNELYLVNQDNSQATGGVILIEKRDTSGAVIWTRSIPNYTIVDAFVSATGEVYVLHTVADAYFVAKYSPSGSLQYTWTISNNFRVEGKTIAADNLGNVYVAFDTVSSTTTRDIMVRKYTSTGGNSYNTVWAQKFGGNANIIDPKSLAVDDSSNLYVSGTLTGSLIANSVTITNSLSSTIPVGFVLKMDNSGTGVWGVKTALVFDPRISAFSGFTGIMLQFSRDKSKLFQLYGPIMYSRNLANGAVYDSLDIDHNYFDVTEAPDGALYIAGKSLLRTNQDTAYVARVNGFVINCSTVSATIDTSICFGESYLGYNATGVYRDTFTLATGCDSVRVLDLTVRPANGSTLNRTICQGENAFGYTTSGVFTDSYIDQFGCDSTRVLNLIVLDTFFTVLSRSICSGDTFMGYTTTGIYYDTLQAVNGCDSITQLNLSVLNVVTSNLAVTICDGDIYEGYGSSGNYVDTFQAVGGCDSIRTLELTVETVNSVIVDTTLCVGEGLNAGGGFQNDAGTYKDTLLSILGCDSVIITTNLTYFDTTARPLIVQNGNSLSIPDSFNGYQWFLNGNAIPDSVSNTLIAQSNGEYSVEITDTNGCVVISDVLQVTGVGLAYFDTNQGWTIFPNPTNGIVSFKIQSINEDVVINIHNLLGDVVSTYEFNPGETLRMDLGNLSPGTYLVITKIGQYQMVNKIMLTPNR